MIVIKWVIILKNKFKYINILIISILFLTSCKSNDINNKSTFDPEKFISNANTPNIDLNVLVNYIVKNLSMKNYSIVKFQLNVQNKEIVSLSIDISNKDSKETYISSYNKKDDLFKISPADSYNSNYSKSNKKLVENINSIINTDLTTKIGNEKYSVYYLSEFKYENISKDFLNKTTIYSISNKKLLTLNKNDLHKHENIFLIKSNKKNLYISF